MDHSVSLDRNAWLRHVIAEYAAHEQLLNTLQGLVKTQQRYAAQLVDCFGDLLQPSMTNPQLPLLVRQLLEKTDGESLSLMHILEWAPIHADKQSGINYRKLSLILGY